MNNYSFDPNKQKKQENFTVDGQKYSFESDGGATPNLGSYSLQNNPYAPKKKSKMVRTLTKPVTTNDSLGPELYSPGSRGFAGVATLAGILAVAGAIITYLVLRY